MTNTMLCWKTAEFEKIVQAAVAEKTTAKKFIKAAVLERAEKILEKNKPI